MKRKCVHCGEDISAKRLAAVPNAIRCVPCVEAVGDVEAHREPRYIRAYKGPTPGWAWTAAQEQQGKE
jgi:hypothetical protein